jgi:predicted secreted Zn-dependent protease
MAAYFFDSSALGKRYHAELGTARVEALFAEPEARHLISRLTAIELQSVFAGKVRTRTITEADLHLLQARFLQDIAQRQFRVVRMTDVHYREAERLIRKHGPRRSLRTLDALQLSVALDLHRRAAMEYFVCADGSLCGVAHEEGLLIINPEQS